MILGDDLATAWSGIRRPDGTPMAPDLPNLPAYLSHQAALTPAAPALTFVDYLASPDGPAVTLTFAELDRRVTELAGRLQALVGREERVAVCTPQGMEYLVGFLAALRAGAIAVPLFDPDLPGQADRLVGVLADCEPVAVLTVAARAEAVQAFADGLDGGRPKHVVAVDGPAQDAPYTPVDSGPDDVAYLQYTSGSTRAPAGVLISHGNIVANAKQAMSAFLGGARPEPLTVVSWLPLFHDMGLVLVTGGALVGGLHAVVMDPVAFLLDPTRWLVLLSAYEQTGSMAPNFAFDYAARRATPAVKETLRLDRVLGILNGAEPVRQETLQNFSETFREQGLPPNAIRPGYGLAEATVYVSGEVRPTPAREAAFDSDLYAKGFASVDLLDGGPAIRLMSCDRPRGQYVAIADPDTGRLLADDEIGEIRVHGPNVARGYWRNEALTAELFGQPLVGAPEGYPTGDWLKTGDLGVVHGGELYITGRIKDLLIVGGRNHYPQDIEETVESAHPVIGLHRVAAFAAPGETGEGIVVVAEVTRHAAAGSWDGREVGRAVRTAVSARHRVQLHDLVLVAPNDIPRTSSGKLARGATRDRYLAGALVPAG